jgi:VanZ family protein
MDRQRKRRPMRRGQLGRAARRKRLLPYGSTPSLKPARMMSLLDSRYPWMARVRNWLPVVAWAGLIFYFSTDQFSSLNTGEIFGFLLSWLFPEMPEKIEPVHGTMRKLGHWGEYFVLSVLFLRALQNETGEKWKLRHAIFALVFILLYALGDEFHQSFIPSRTASLGDVTIDVLGGICGVVWMYWYGKGILTPLISRVG